MDDNLQRMRDGRIYDPGDPALAPDQTAGQELLYDFNATRPSQCALRQELLASMFASLGEGVYIEPPLHANWGGRHVHFGSYVYANYNLTLVDDGDIHVGDKVMFGPNVVVTSAAHPVLPALREHGLQYNLPVRIERNVWVGSGVQIMPGVTIGENSVIGAGSVVTKDVPANVVAAGVPCRVLREIDDRDREFYWRDRPVDVPVD